jgi:amidophosphoribosyltransferase
MIAFALAEAVNDGEDWVKAAEKALNRCQGAFSLVIGTADGLMGVRDHQGIRPLVLGVLGSNPPGEGGEAAYVLASETCALDIIGATYLRDIQPGELVWITPQGLTSHQWADPTPRKLCIFEMI